MNLVLFKELFDFLQPLLFSSSLTFKEKQNTVKYHFTIQLSLMAARLRLSSTAVRLRLWSSVVNARLLSSITVIPRLTLQMQYLLISLQPLLINEPFVITVSEEKRLLSQAIPTQRFTVITLPWKRLLQTRYNTKLFF
jgi:hypothetical protein